MAKKNRLWLVLVGVLLALLLLQGVAFAANQSGGLGWFHDMPNSIGPAPNCHGNGACSGDVGSCVMTDSEG